MNKQEIRNILQEARTTHDFYINDGQVLLDGINLDRLEEPVPLEECHLTHWCVSHHDSISDFPWFIDLKESHSKLHNKFSVLFHESMRKYNPKTFDQLLERYDDLKAEAQIFNTKLEEAEAEIENMPEEQFTNISSVEANSSMQSIDIAGYEEVSDTENAIDLDNNQNGDSRQDTEIDIVDIDKNDIDTSDNQTHHDIDKNTSKHFANTSASDNDKNQQENHADENGIDNSETIKKHISLKEQNIAQLQQEKELSQLELAHLEETQKLTLQSVKQIDKSFNLKQQEIELDHKDNDQLLTFKSNARTETVENLDDITEKTQSVREQIKSLENQILEDQAKRDADKSSATIAKQFEELKLNKHKDLEILEQHLQTRKIDLKQLKEQVLLLEEEISEMESDVSKKNQDMSNLKEKEKIKNEEIAAQLAEFERIKGQRQSSIRDKEVELEVLLMRDKEKQKQLETIDFQMNELKKKNEALDQSNTEILSDLDHQQQVKSEKVRDINRLKKSKEAEITDIDNSIAKAESSLQELKSSQHSSVIEQEPAIVD